MGQQVKYFAGGWDTRTDHTLANEIEQYAEQKKLRIVTLSYSVGARGHALVVFEQVSEHNSKDPGASSD